MLWHVIRRIRRHWPNVRILVRGDCHYCAPEVLDLLRRLRCDYILGLPINVKLDAIARPWREQCERRREAGRSKKVRRMHQLTYQAGSWSRAEKVIARVEATEMGSDARFVVTNLTGRAKVLYEKVYCARGRMENLIKDMKLYTRSDKTACSRWQANQFRLFLHMGAYWLLHSVRMAAPKRSRWRGATFATIRAVFVKIACRVEELKTRIKENVIARVEATEMGSDARFIVTSLTGRGKVLYEKVYCARGRMENRPSPGQALIKDMKLYTRSDKTACSRWQANQFRLFLHMGAYWLLHSVRMAAPKRSRWRGATFATIRSVFVKIACRVEELKTRIKLSFPAHLPHADALATITARLCAQRDHDARGRSAA